MLQWGARGERILEAARAFRPFLPGFVLNAGLMVAVVAFDWSLIEIALLYVLKIAVINLVYLSVALFTPQPIEDLNEGR